MGGLARGFAQLFKQGSKRFGNAIDNFLLDKEARKAISDEVGKKFQPFIDRVSAGEKRKATNITELDKKLAESKKALQDARADWQQKYNAALADAKNQKQTEISDYDAKLQAYKDALDQANTSKQGILDQLSDQEAKFDQSRTVFIDVNTGKRYIFNPVSGKYDDLGTIYQGLNSKDQLKLVSRLQNYETRLFDPNSGNKVINAFDNYGSNAYKGKSEFDNYLQRLEGQNAVALRNADNQVNKANADLNSWNSNNTRPKDWDDNVDLQPFNQTYEQTNGKLPNKYTFNGQTYSKEADLDKAYQDALKAKQKRKDLYSRVA